MQQLFTFEYSPWYIGLCLLAGLLVAWLQYSARAPWPAATNRWLFALRALLINLLAFLLLGPGLRLVRKFFEKPVAVVAVDNSRSVALATSDSLRSAMIGELHHLQEALADAGWQVKFSTLNKMAVNPDSLRFDAVRSDIAGMLRRIVNTYQGANLGALIVVSDGIFNSGFAPDALTMYTPVYTVGVGDTIPRHDLSIIEVQHNKTVYQGNQFPLEVLIRNEGMGPATSRVGIYRDGRLLTEKPLEISPSERLLRQRFLLTADKGGKHRYEVRLQPVADEATLVNNRTGFYVDIIEGKQKILLAADVPTPDVKALRLALEAREQFEVEVKINQTVNPDDYQLLILVQVPARKAFSSKLKPLLTSSVARLIIAGTDADLKALRQAGLLSINNVAGKPDKVTGVVNNDFDDFHLDHNPEELLAGSPPVYVPFGDVQLAPDDKVLLWQQVGSVPTRNPLIWFKSGEPRQGVWLGNGYWRWRLNEYARFGETARFDELVTKTAMYLAARPDKRQFRVYPLKDQYEEGESIMFVAELYNEIYEPLYGIPVNLTIVNDSLQRQYTFTPVVGNRQFVVEDLPAGLYRFSATANIRGKQHRVSGQLAIDNPEIEETDLTADFTTLRKLATASGGSFFTIDNLKELTDTLAQRQAPAIIHTREKEALLLQLPWALVVLLLLATTEWLTRKSSGGY